MLSGFWSTSLMTLTSIKFYLQSNSGLIVVINFFDELCHKLISLCVLMLSSV
jgi:hypothetical protein